MSARAPASSTPRSWPGSNRHYLKLAAPDRLAQLALPFLQQLGWVTEPDAGGRRVSRSRVPRSPRPLSIASIRCRRGCISCSTTPRRAALANPAIRAEALEARGVIAALADELAKSGALTDKETFRAAAARVREKTGAKGQGAVSSDSPRADGRAGRARARPCGSADRARRSSSPPRGHSRRLLRIGSRRGVSGRA